MYLGSWLFSIKTMNLFDTSLDTAFKEDKQLLTNTKIPVVTVSASFKEDIKRLHGLKSNNTTEDVVFSRAHYSMALGIVMQAWCNGIDPKEAWFVDPTNYVASKQWRSIALTETIGKTIARYPILKTLKDIVDRFARKSLPILKSITPPLLYLTHDIHKPILSLHIATGNILLGQGKTVVQVVTDPHVRDEYVQFAHLPHAYYCVFDANTKLAFLEKAAFLEVDVDPRRVIITGPPVDPRIVEARKKKMPWRSGTLKLCITTGGLGTNKDEILDAVEQLLPELRKRPTPFQLLVYTATHDDIYEQLLNLAKEYHVSVGDLDDEEAKLRIIYHPQIMDANELLIQYGFPWADGFITKPSGDMAYDAAASGSFILTLKEWGEWEHNVRVVFEQKQIAHKLEIEHVVPQLELLMSSQSRSRSWIESAMSNAMTLEPLFLKGAENIIETYRKAK